MDNVGHVVTFSILAYSLLNRSTLFLCFFLKFIYFIFSFSPSWSVAILGL